MLLYHLEGDDKMRVVHCYGQTPETTEAIHNYFSAPEGQLSDSKLDYPKYDKYEEGRPWQPTVCGLRAPSIDVVRPSDFVALVNHTDPKVDQDKLAIALEFPGLPYMDGDVLPDAAPCVECKEAAPMSWPFLEYFAQELE